MKSLLLSTRWTDIYKSTALLLETCKVPGLCNLGWKKKWKSRKPVLEAQLYSHFSQQELLLEHKYKAFYFYLPIPQSTPGREGLSDEAHAALDSSAGTQISNGKGKGFSEQHRRKHQASAFDPYWPEIIYDRKETCFHNQKYNTEYSYGDRRQDTILA